MVAFQVGFFDNGGDFVRNAFITGADPQDIALHGEVLALDHGCLRLEGQNFSDIQNAKDDRGGGRRVCHTDKRHGHNLRIRFVRVRALNNLERLQSF